MTRKNVWFVVHAIALVVGLCGLGGMAVTASWWGVAGAGALITFSGATATRGGRAALSLRGIRERLATARTDEERRNVERANAFMVALVLGLLGVTAMIVGIYQAT